jgi:hypothetical protein
MYQAIFSCQKTIEKLSPYPQENLASDIFREKYFLFFDFKAVLVTPSQ